MLVKFNNDVSKKIPCKSFSIIIEHLHLSNYINHYFIYQSYINHYYHLSNYINQLL